MASRWSAAGGGSVRCGHTAAFGVVGLPSEHLGLLGRRPSSPSFLRTARVLKNGGPRAGDSASGSTGSARWRKKRSMLAGSVTSARSFMREPQRSHRSASMASILFISRAQDQ